MERLREQLASGAIMVNRDTLWWFLLREGLRFKKTQFAFEQMWAVVTRKRARRRMLPR